jgi:hypothetical protein
MNGFILRNFLIKLVGVFYRAIFHTGSTTRAFILDNISGLFNQSYFEVSCFPFDTINFGISQDLYIRMPSNLDELRSEYSYGAVVGGKGLIELGHMTANGRRLVDKVHFKTRRGKVKGCLHATDPAADNHYVSKITPRETLPELLNLFFFQLFSLSDIPVVK